MNDAISTAIVDYARRHECLPELCTMIDYDPDIGIVSPYWRPKHGVRYLVEHMLGGQARLIAAAPELYEALELLLDALGALTNKNELDGHGLPKDEIDFIYSALAKAKGKA